jgi:hypothetical protein
MWKIKNISNAPVKIAGARTGGATVGIIMKPGEFCITESKMTTSIDAQERRKLIEIDRNFANELKLTSCECYNESSLNKAAKEADDYSKS